MSPKRLALAVFDYVVFLAWSVPARQIRHLARRVRRRGTKRQRSQAAAQRQAAVRRAEQDVERELARLADRSALLVAGPWLSEVGYEVLYWIPFLRWWCRKYDIAPARLVAVSRGGVASWYAGIADQYVELFDWYDPEQFGRRNQARRGDGSLKQLAIADFDEDILRRLRERLGTDRFELCHPSLMYRLFGEFWQGRRPLQFLVDRTRYARLDGVRPLRLEGVPDEYVAVKLYTAASLREAPETRARLQELVTALADRTHVVLLDTGLAVDDHRDYGVGEHARITSLASGLPAHENLLIQSRLIAGARAFVGTCGSLAWLAPLVGVETVGLFSDPKLLHQHIYVARRAYTVAGAAAFIPCDVRTFDHFPLAVSRSSVFVGLRQPAD